MTVVNQIFQSFVHDGQAEAEIVADLNAREIKTGLDRSWTPTVVRLSENNGLSLDACLTSDTSIHISTLQKHSFPYPAKPVRAAISEVSALAGFATVSSPACNWQTIVAACGMHSAMASLSVSVSMTRARTRFFDPVAAQLRHTDRKLASISLDANLSLVYRPGQAGPERLRRKLQR
ncbi:hypothetical protein [uncultured Roseobacter sp.]|uniref:hypothetical protein n=1 Tax=uncultured Roseobacter sp. TaxID=114847 RepID=UPI00260A2CEA|nr:hypothetical protein [uncultured Roseobacter sp.]